MAQICDVFVPLGECRSSQVLGFVLDGILFYRKGRPLKSTSSTAMVVKRKSIREIG